MGTENVTVDLAKERAASEARLAAKRAEAKERAAKVRASAAATKRRGGSGRRSKLAGLFIVRAPRYRDGSNPRRAGANGFFVYDLIPTDNVGIVYEELREGIERLKTEGLVKSGDLNHIAWDLNSGASYLRDPEVSPEEADPANFDPFDGIVFASAAAREAAEGIDPETFAGAEGSGKEGAFTASDVRALSNDS